MNKKTCEALRLLALAKLINEKGEDFKESRAAIGPGRYDVDATVHVHGTLTVSPDTDAAPTASIPLLPTLALTLAYCGVRRDQAKELLARILTQAINATDGAGAAAALAETMPWLEPMVEEIKSEIVAQLPRQPRKGAVKADLVWEPVLLPDPTPARHNKESAKPKAEHWCARPKLARLARKRVA